MNKIVIHCKTEKQARKLMKLYESWGLKWLDNGTYRGIKLKGYYTLAEKIMYLCPIFAEPSPLNCTILTYKQLKHILKHSNEKNR